MEFPAPRITTAIRAKIKMMMKNSPKLFEKFMRRIQLYCMNIPGVETTDSARSGRVAFCRNRVETANNHKIAIEFLKPSIPTEKPYKGRQMLTTATKSNRVEPASLEKCS
jgi:hypothetical protein